MTLFINYVLYHISLIIYLIYNVIYRQKCNSSRKFESLIIRSDTSTKRYLCYHILVHESTLNVTLLSFISGSKSFGWQIRSCCATLNFKRFIMQELLHGVISSILKLIINVQGKFLVVSETQERKAITGFITSTFLSIYVPTLMCWVSL